MNLGLSRNQTIGFYAAILIAISYLLVPFSEGSIENIVQKSLACIILAFVGFSATKHPKNRKLLLLALLMSSLGDMFLAIRTGDYFVQGLGSFLIAHLIYIAIFARNRDWDNSHPTARFVTAAVIVIALVMMFLLWPTLGALKAPVFIYITVISLMSIAAAYSQFAYPIVVFGAVSFMFSDATIAVNKFLAPFAASGPLIWITYILAQALITLAIIKGPQTKKAGETPA